MERKYYEVFTLRLANYLMHQGLNLIGAKDDKYDSSKKVYYFIDTPELRAGLARYSKR